MAGCVRNVRFALLARLWPGMSVLPRNVRFVRFGAFAPKVLFDLFFTIITKGPGFSWGFLFDLKITNCTSSWGFLSKD